MKQQDRLRRARAELYGLGSIERALAETKRGEAQSALTLHQLSVRNELRARYGRMGAVSMHKDGRKPKKPRWQDHVERVRDHDD